MANKKQTKAITTYDIEKPGQVMLMAKVLKEYIIKNNLSVRIADKDYVMVEGWQFAGGTMGLFPRVAEVQNVGAGKWTAKVEIVGKDGRVISTGYALCSKEEMKKRSFDEYAILSMAQTRAIGKAYRNLIGWVVKAAGYEATPAEEMKEKPAEAIKTKTSAGNLMAGEQEKEKIKILAKDLGYNTISQIEKATGLKIDFNTMTKNQSSRVYAELLQIKLAQK
jgi:hypothetical protein